MCASSWLLRCFAAVRTFDEQVAEAQRLLRELDHSMAVYDSTHGDGSTTVVSDSTFSHSLSLSIANQTDEQTGDGSNAHGGGGGGGSSPAITPATPPALPTALDTATAPESQPEAEPEPRDQLLKQDKQSESEPEQDPTHSDRSGTDVQERSAALVMAGEDLDDLM
jgi:hypothetical protein